MAGRIFRESPWGEYEVVGFRPSWTSVSYLLLALAVGAHYWLRFLPWKPANRWLWPFITALAVTLFSFLGSGAALLALRRVERRIMPRIGLVMNGLVFVFSALALAGMVYVRFR